AEHHQATHLLMLARLEQGKTDNAAELADRELERDPFSFGVLFERSRTSDSDWRDFNHRIGNSSHNFIELANDYAAAGCYDRAIEVLTRFVNQVGEQIDTPLVYYYLADFHGRV